MFERVHDDDKDDWPIRQRHTRATQGQHKAKIAASVFDLAHSTLTLRGEVFTTIERRYYRVEQMGGRTRYTGIPERETDAWKEREAQRRAAIASSKPFKNARAQGK